MPDPRLMTWPGSCKFQKKFVLSNLNVQYDSAVYWMSASMNLMHVRSRFQD